MSKKYFKPLMGLIAAFGIVTTAPMVCHAGSLSRPIIEIIKPYPPKLSQTERLKNAKTIEMTSDALIFNRNSSNEDKASIYQYRGLLRYENGDVSGAQEDFNQAIELVPYYADAYNRRGLLKEEALNDIKGALRDYTKAIEIEPDLRMAYYNRGLLRFKLKDFDGAIADYNTLIQKSSDFTYAYLHRSIIRYYRFESTKSSDLKEKQAILQDLRMAQKLAEQNADKLHQKISQQIKLWSDKIP
jgi:tetratricopeptide (TPR) repeat protein